MKRTPFSILILAILIGFGAIIQLLLGATLALTGFEVILGLLLLIQGALNLWIAVGLYYGNKYAWFGALFLTGLSILSNVLSWGHDSREMITISIITNIIVLAILLWNRSYYLEKPTTAPATASLLTNEKFKFFRRV